MILGDKDDATYDPSGLIARSQADGSDGVIFVSLNYRLGLFGWLNGAGDEAILPNVGLQDQRLALEWWVIPFQHFLTYILTSP